MVHITTFTGEGFMPLSPDIDQIEMRDVTHALSLIYQVNGHYLQLYSVAQHGS